MNKTIYHYNYLLLVF